MEDGILLDNQTDGVGGSDDDETTCVEGPKTDRAPNGGETILVGSGTVTIEKVHYEDDEPVGFDWTSDGVSICQAVVKGAPDRDPEPTRYKCGTSGTAYAPENDGNQNRTYYGISHFTFYYCEGGDGGDGECWPNSTTQYFGFSWELHCEVGNEVQGDSLSFDFDFYAEQCCHNATPTNPFDE
ncbi:hypothetical protein [Haladaptatus sp. NG-WS-4]